MGNSSQSQAKAILAAQSEWTRNAQKALGNKAATWAKSTNKHVKVFKGAKTWNARVFTEICVD